MKTIMKCGFMVLLALVLGKDEEVFAAKEWSYDAPNDASTWSQNFELCNGKAQSPINIVTTDTVLNTDLAGFDRSIFDIQPDSMLIKNNGHSIQVDLEGGSIIDNTAFLPSRFKAAQFHLHWGKPNEKGSEHTLDDTRFFGELHVVHYNMKYSSLGNAASQPDGLAVLGYFIKDDYEQDNLAFGRVLNRIASNETNFYKDNHTYAETFSLETLVPPGDSVYYRYRGSLTTPACYESVEWTVFENVIRISPRQANILRTMVFENERESEEDPVPLYGNFRPVQPLNDRVVTKYQPCSGTVTTLKNASSFLLLGLASVLCFIFGFHS